MDTRLNRAVALTLLVLGSLVCHGCGTYVDVTGGFKVVNNDALNKRVRNGDVTRSIIVDEAALFALAFLYVDSPSSATPADGLYYLAIVTQPAADPSLWNPVWSANREKPVHDGAVLELDGSGNLMLCDADGTVVWRSGTTELDTKALQLDLSGNLQLWDSSNETIWQSFDSPTDTVLPGQYVRSGQSLVSAVKSKDMDYSEGPYTLKAYPGGIAMYANYTGDDCKPYYTLSVEAKLKHDMDAVLHTCRHPNDLFFDSSYGLVIQTDFTKDSPAAEPSLCGNGDTMNSTRVIAMKAEMMEGGGTQQFVRLDGNGWLHLYQYNIISRSFESVGNVSADPSQS